MPAPYAPPDQWAPPPPAGTPPPAPAYGAAPPGYAPSPLPYMAYESNKKSQGLALVLEFLIPGVGSAYAEHAMGAAITWGGMLGGVALIVGGLSDTRSQGDVQTLTDQGAAMITVGIVAILGFRIYGFVDAYSSTGDYNVELARRLKLPDINLSVAPLRTPQGTALAPTLTLRF
jgi:hypothetical protein